MSEFNEDRIRKRIIKLASNRSVVRAREAYELVFKSEEVKLTKLLLKMDDEGVIRLRIINPRIRSLSQYVSSLYALDFWLTTVTVFITLVITVLNITTWPIILVRYVLGSAYVLFLPGHALIEALYPRDEDLTALERLALSLGLSLAVVPLIGLILNYTPWGIRLTPVSVSLALFTQAMATIALFRKFKYFKFLRDEVLRILSSS